MKHKGANGQIYRVVETTAFQILCEHPATPGFEHGMCIQGDSLWRTKKEANSALKELLKHLRIREGA